MAYVGNIQQGYVGKLDGQTFYKGANGKTVVRKITTPKNPQTLAQNIQRVITLTVGANYKAMKAIADHSFEGCSMGYECANKFRSINAKRMRERAVYLQENNISLYDYFNFLPKGSLDFMPAAVFISDGTLNQVYAGINAQYKGEVAVSDNTYAAVINSLGAQRGDQMTFVTVEKNLNGKYQFHYARVILDPRNENGSAALSVPFIAEGAINCPNSRNNGLLYNLAIAGGKLTFSLTASDKVVACGIIMSRKVDNTWLRSTCQLALSEDALGADKISLMDAAQGTASGTLIVDNDEAYLNNAGVGGAQGSVTPTPTPQPGEEEAVYSQTAKINNVSQSIAGGSVSTSSLTKVELMGEHLSQATPYMTKNGEGQIAPTLEDDNSQEWTIDGAQVGDIYRFYNDSQLLLTITVIESSGGDGGDDN
jgi:hypothetical protein